MTTETKKASDAPRSDDEEQSFLPTVLAGAGILAVAALLIFWPSDDDAKGKDGQDGKTQTSASARGGGAGGAGAHAAGVAARPSDAPTTQSGRKINPAIKLPHNRGMAPAMPEVAQEPPADATVDEQITFWENRLDAAIRMRDNRKKFYDRLPALEERIKSSPNPEQSMETFERRKSIVEDNYDKAKAEVERIEGKLAELRG